MILPIIRPRSLTSLRLGFLIALLVLTLPFGLGGSISFANDLCKDDLRQIELNREFSSQFLESVPKALERLGVPAADFKKAKIEQVAGTGEYAARKAFIFTQGDNAWWFAQGQTFFINRKVFGRFDDAGGEKRLKKILGPQLFTTDSGVQYLYKSQALAEAQAGEAKKAESSIPQAQVTEAEIAPGQKIGAEAKETDSTDEAMALQRPPVEAMGEVFKGRTDEATRKFMKLFSGSFAQEEFTRTSFDPESFKNIKIDELTGSSQKPGTTAFVMKLGTQTWWFIDAQGRFKKKQQAGDLNTIDGSVRLSKLLGSKVSTVDHAITYEFHYANQRFIKTSNAADLEFAAFKAKFIAHSSEIKGDIHQVSRFLTDYADLLLSESKKGNVDLDSFIGAQFLAYHPKYERKPLFWLVLPADPHLKCYVFRNIGDIRFMQVIDSVLGTEHDTQANMGLSRSYQVLDSSLVFHNAPSNVKNYEGEWYPVFEMLDKQEVYVFYDMKKGEPVSASLNFIDPRFLKTVEADLREKDNAADRYEAGPYDQFVNTYFSSFMKSGFVNVHELQALKEIEVLGDGYAEHDQNKTFTLIRYRNQTFFCTRHKGRTVIDYFFENRDENVFRAPRANKRATLDFIKIFGNSVVLPSQKVLRFFFNPIRGQRVSISDRSQDVQTMLNEFKISGEDTEAAAEDEAD